MNYKVSKIRFTGNFWEYFFTSIFLLILSVLTVGILLPYWTYWSAKYFFSKLELVEKIEE